MFPQNPQSNVIPKKLPNFFIYLFLVVATVAVFSQIRNHDFVDFDDNRYVTENQHVKAGLNAENIKWAFSTVYAEFWHPLTWLSFMLDTQLSGVNAGRYLTTNLLLHVINTLLLFALLEKITGRMWQSAFVAALFALHPLHVESVAWIAQRKDVLSTLFWMSTMISYACFIEQPTFSRYLAVLLFFILGLMSKPMLVTLPFVLLLMDYWPFGRLRLSASFKTAINSTYPLVWEKIPLFSIAALISIVTLWTQKSGGSLRSIKAVPLYERIANAAISYVSYLGKMLWPQNLSCFYPYSGAFPWWHVAGALLLIVLVSGFCLRSARNYPYLIIGWLWYLGTLVPVIGFVKIGGFAMADRYTYVPLIGIFIMVAWGFPDLLKKWPHRKPALTIGAGLVLSLCFAATWFQVGLWQNSYTLFEHALRSTSDNYIAHNSFALALKKRGRIDEAIQHFSEALRIKPNYARAHFNFGNTLAMQGKFSEAIDHLRAAVRIKPDLAEAHNNLGVLLEEQGKINEAAKHFTAAIGTNPHDAGAHYNLGNTLVRLGRFDEAIGHYFDALQENPEDANVHYSLGIVFEKQGKMDTAFKEFSAAVKENPGLAEAHYSLGNIMAKQGKSDEAIGYYQKALSIKPFFFEALNNLALTHVAARQYDMALKAFKQAAALYPDNAALCYNIAGVYALQDKVENSIAWLKKAVDKGYDNWKLIKTDKDLENIRHSAAYNELLNGR